MFKFMTEKTLYGDLKVSISFDKKSGRYEARHVGVLNRRMYSLVKLATSKAEIFKRVDEMVEEVRVFRKRHGLKIIIGGKI